MGVFGVRLSSSLPEEFWRENVRGGWATAVALLFVLIWHLKKKLGVPFFFRSSSAIVNVVTDIPAAPGDSGIGFSSSKNPKIRISEIVTNADLKKLIDDLDERVSNDEKWENVINKGNNLLSYHAKCSKPKAGPLKYISLTTFENCSAEVLRDFYMDNGYRKQWDKTVVSHEQLQVDEGSGIEIGRTIKKYPLLTPREYVSAWRLWEGEDKAFYCFTKECEHPLTPRQKKYVRVAFFRSGWRIRNVPGRNACEIKMVHQEDAGMNVEMAKLAFAKGIWSYVCKMDSALRKYSATNCPRTSSAVGAINLIQKVPSRLDATMNSAFPALLAPSTANTTRGRIAGELADQKIGRMPSRKLVANGLLILGGLVCLSRGHSGLGAKVAMAYILAKLNKRRASRASGGQD